MPDDTDIETIDFSGDGDDRDDLTPGADVSSELFGSVDETVDYETEAQTWIGEPATTELAIETVGGIDVKRFVLEEPDSDESMERIARGIMNGDRHEVCDELVREPTLSGPDGEPNDVWREKLTGRERELIFDHGLAWIRVSSFVDLQAMLEAGDFENWSD